MCGFAGIFDRGFSGDPKSLERQAAAMARRLVHRGPDDEGVWCDDAAGFALGHRRLAIIDCDPSGHQPMVSSDGRYVIAYNGEVYNYREIAADLKGEGCTVTGGSDTAVLLEACRQWGVEKALSQCVGMFAFALWDRKERSLTLARDRMGIKPLYWGQLGETFLFGSELKALRAYEGFEGALDRRAVGSFLRHAYIPAPHTIFDNIHKLRPGHYLIIPEKGEVRDQCYWNLRSIAAGGERAPFEGSFEAATDTLEALLKDAVGSRMVSDVPLGAFLSGGIDSSAVVALMQAQSNQRVRTFSIGFHESDYNEAADAKAVAAHLGTDHTELYVTPDEARDLIPDLPAVYDEPFADSSQIPTMLLSRMTRQHVTVALSGDGGDEVFAGYNRYFWAERIWRSMGVLPRSVRSGLSRGLGAVPPAWWNAMGGALPSRRLPGQLGDKVRKFAAILKSSDMEEVYLRLVSQWEDPSVLTHDGDEHKGILWDAGIAKDRPDALGRMQLLDMATYLPDDILTKVDRASMAYSLEARVPLIDHRVVEFAWTLPRPFLVHEGKGKRILRSVLDRYVPKKLMDRPKMGFGVPIDHWLRGPLRDWAEDLLDEKKLRDDGFLEPSPIRSAWDQHLSGRSNMQYALWTVLMFQSWRQHDADKTGAGV